MVRPKSTESPIPNGNMYDTASLSFSPDSAFGSRRAAVVATFLSLTERSDNELILSLL